MAGRVCRRACLAGRKPEIGRRTAGRVGLVGHLDLPATRVAAITGIADEVLRTRTACRGTRAVGRVLVCVRVAVPGVDAARSIRDRAMAVIHGSLVDRRAVRDIVFLAVPGKHLQRAGAAAVRRLTAALGVDDGDVGNVSALAVVGAGDRACGRGTIRVRHDVVVLVLANPRRQRLRAAAASRRASTVGRNGMVDASCRDGAGFGGRRSGTIAVPVGSGCPVLTHAAPALQAGRARAAGRRAPAVVRNGNALRVVGTGLCRGRRAIAIGDRRAVGAPAGIGQRLRAGAAGRLACAVADVRGSVRAGTRAVAALRGCRRRAIGFRHGIAVAIRTRPVAVLKCLRAAAAGVRACAVTRTRDRAAGVAGTIQCGRRRAVRRRDGGSIGARAGKAADRLRSRTAAAGAAVIDRIACDVEARAGADAGLRLRGRRAVARGKRIAGGILATGAREVLGADAAGVGTGAIRRLGRTERGAHAVLRQGDFAGIVAIQRVHDSPVRPRAGSSGDRRGAAATGRHTGAIHGSGPCERATVRGGTGLRGRGCGAMAVGYGIAAAVAAGIACKRRCPGSALVRAGAVRHVLRTACRIAGTWQAGRRPAQCRGYRRAIRNACRSRMSRAVYSPRTSRCRSRRRYPKQCSCRPRRCWSCPKACSLPPPSRRYRPKTRPSPYRSCRFRCRRRFCSWMEWSNGGR